VRIGANDYLQHLFALTCPHPAYQS